MGVLRVIPKSISDGRMMEAMSGRTFIPSERGNRENTGHGASGEGWEDQETGYMRFR